MDERSPVMSSVPPNYAGVPPQAGYPQPQAGTTPYPQPQAGTTPYPHPQSGATPYPQPQAGTTPYPQPQAGTTPYPQPQAGTTPYPQPQAGTTPYPPHSDGVPPQHSAYQQGPNAGVPPAADAVPAYKGDVPAADLKDDPNLKGPTPSAPPANLLDSLPGYSNVGFEGTYLPPPSYEESQQVPPARSEYQMAPGITEEEAREALLDFVGEHCCYGKKPAVEMKFNELKASSAFHYTLESFGEGRSTKWTFEPYKGQGISVSGPPPGPWDVMAQPLEMFKSSKLDVEVPNTASVKPCHGCFSSGFQRCYRCHGRGRLFCNSCNGSGRERHFENGEERRRSCVFCHGSGRKMCYTCNGMGQIRCADCKGHCNLRWFILLTVKWTNHVDHHILERTALPDELIKGVSGQVAFEDSALRVWPVNHFPEQEINSASNRLITQHSTSFNTERILMQRHKIRVIPVTEVFYKYKDDRSSFFVYGFEHKVFAPDYPAQCCCGCSVL